MRAGGKTGTYRCSGEMTPMHRREFPCSCGALPGEYCRTWDGRKTYNVHLDRLRQENEAWQLDRAPEPGDHDA
jgi:hypothetical protein